MLFYNQKGGEMKVKTIILRVLAIALSLAAMISMAGGAYFSQMSGAGQSVNGENVAFGDWFEALNGESSILLGDAEGTWKGSEAFFIISIILLSLLIIAVVLQFFIKKNWLQIVVRIISIIALNASVTILAETETTTESAVSESTSETTTALIDTHGVDTDLSINAEACILIDAETGVVIYEKNEINVIDKTS